MDEFDEATLNQIVEVTEAAEHDDEVTPEPQYLEVLSKLFGHRSFRPLQWQIISAVIKDKRDVCAVMCTGYGKSICFQYPSTFMGGITLVISPLIALMEDQILSLRVSNIPACLLGSAQRKQGQVIDQIFSNEYRMIYLTPELCTSEMGRDLLRRMNQELNINLIAIDEAHCISSWGHDFRHHYRELGLLRNLLPQVPIMAVTATATCRVRQDIISSLNLRNPLLLVSSFNRPNLYFQVHPKGTNGVYKDLTKVMDFTKSGWRFSGPTIIYCLTRKQTDETADTLRVAGINCRPFHAGLPLRTRQEVHEDFIKDKIDVIVATIAFGMGIDKPDIRNVVHFGAFKSVESYYQGAGRAGRDGLPANCVVFFSSADFITIRNIEEIGGNAQQNKNNLKDVQEYLNTRQCRRKFILRYFEDADDLVEPRSNCCDNCTKKLTDSRPDHEKYEGVDASGCYDFTKDGRLFLQVIDSLKPGLGLTTYILFLRGSNSKKISEQYKKHSLHGAGRNSSEEWWKALGKLLVQENYFLEEARKTHQGFSYCTVSLTSKGKEALASKDSEIMLPPSAQLLKLLRPKPQTGWINCKPGPSLPLKMDAEIDDEEKMALYKKLLDGRADLATRDDCMPYTIASNSALMNMAQFQPKTREELRHLNLDGFTETKIMKFGNTFLKIINDYTEKKPIKKSEDVSDQLLDAFLTYAEQVKNEEDSDDTDIENEPPQKKEKTESKTDLKTDFDIILDSPPQIRVGSNFELTGTDIPESSKTKVANKKSKKKLPPWLSNKKIN